MPVEAQEQAQDPVELEAAQILEELAAEDEAIEAADTAVSDVELAEEEPEVDQEEFSAEAIEAENRALRAMNATLQQAHAALARRYDEMRQIDVHLATKVLDEQEKAKIPSRDEDPLGHFEAKLDTIGEALKARAEEQEARQRLAEQQNQAQAINAAVEHSCRAAQEEWPEFPECVQHIATTIVNVLERSGRSEEEARQIAAAQLNEIAVNALRSREDPADALWEAAWHLGYRADDNETESEVRQPSAQDPALAARQFRAEQANARREPRTTTPPAAPLKGTEILELSQDELLRRFREDPEKADSDYMKAMEIYSAAAAE